MDIVHSETLGGLSIKIWTDDDPWNPRDGDNLGVMVLLHRRYNLPYEHKGTNRATAMSIDNWDDLNEYIVDDLERDGDKLVALFPVYMIDHSGTWFKASDGGNPFDPWDSGCVGFIYTTRKRVEEFLGAKKMTTAVKEKIKKSLFAEVEEYSKYSSGECYGYDVLDESGQLLDSCGGYYDYQLALASSRANARVYESQCLQACTRMDGRHNDLQ